MILRALLVASYWSINTMCPIPECLIACSKGLLRNLCLSPMEIGFITSNLAYHYKVWLNHYEIWLNHYENEPYHYEIGLNHYDLDHNHYFFHIVGSIYLKYKERLPEGILLGLFLISVFGMRFIWEYFKAVQVDFEESMALNMGQILSIPLVIAGIILVIRALKNGLKPEKN